MKEKAHDVLQRAFTHVVKELFTHYTGTPPELRLLTAEESEQPIVNQELDTQRMLCATAGFGNDQLKSSLCLLTHVQSAQDLCEGEVACPCDWICELTNQAVGRMKNYVAEYGIRSTMTLPILVTGEEIGFPSQAGNQLVLNIDSASGNAVALLNFEIDSQQQWEKDATPSCAQEGSLCFF